MLGIAGIVIVASAGAAGAMYALNSGTSTNAAPQKIEEQPQEEVKQKNGWIEENGDKYFYKDNEKQTNWIQDNNSWYYLGSDGKMETGWIRYNGNCFYLNNDGTMATNTTVGDYYVDENGFLKDNPSSKKAAQSSNSQISSSQNNDSRNSTTPQTTINRKPTSKEDAKNIVEQEDGIFIQELKDEFPKEFVHPTDCHLQLETGEIKNVQRYCNLSWDMPDEDCYTVYISEYGNGEKGPSTEYKAIYFVGIETGNIYLVPHDGNKPVYQIKNNKIIKRFPWLSINGSDEWH